MAVGSSAFAEEKIIQRHILKPGEEIKISVPSNTPARLGFEFEVGSQSWNETKNCPVIKIHGVDNRHCGAIENGTMRAKREGRSVDPLGDGYEVSSQFGGAVPAAVINGQLTAYLKSMAHQEMEFLVTFEPLD